MKKILSLLCSMMLAVVFNSVIGATISTAVFGGDALIGALAANGISLLAGHFIPYGSMPAGVFTEIWTGEMIKAFRPSAESTGWYDRIRSYDQAVENDVIHFTEIGGDPDVLVNNTTYPLDIQALTDTDKPVSLDKFDTKATPVTDDELHAVSYDKMGSVLERHRDSINMKKREKAIHAIAPANNSANHPVLLTSEVGKFTFDDILALKRKFDKWLVPQEGRVLVLSPDHANDLLETEQKFREQYNINQNEGKIARLYGFDIYEYGAMPYYDGSDSTLPKKAFGSVAAGTDKQATVAYYEGRMMKANGSLSFYYSEASQDPLYHRNLVNFRQWSICLPLTDKKCAAAVIYQ